MYRYSRLRSAATWASAASFGLALSFGAAAAADLTESVSPGGLKDDPGAMAGDAHATIPAGVTGAAMVGQGEGMLMYMPMYMDMQGTYIGADKASTAAILTTPNRFAPPPYLRVVPDSMDAQMHMFGVEYGLSDRLNILAMGSFVDKSMTMTSYSMPAPPAAWGSATSSVEGAGDLSVAALYRLYDDGVNHVHLNLGFSFPVGSTTEEATMLAPKNGMPMTMRAMYGMQLGTGTVDIMPGITYTGVKGLWSWGAAYRGRFALDDNAEGYHWGDSHLLTGWAGYTFCPGITATARVAGSIQGKIEGIDPMIAGPMQGTNPAWYGGETVTMFGGVEIAGHHFGLDNVKLAIEAGAPVYQDLNGPQLGQNWQLNAALSYHF
jgi:hypothetical protein